MSMTERVCNKCGWRYFCSKKNAACPMDGCDGVMCRVVQPVVGKRLSGTLYRDESGSGNSNEIYFIPEGKLSTKDHLYWSREQWKKQYGKLPKRGSVECIILEISNVQ